MWLQHLVRLSQQFPQSVELEPPATLPEIAWTEERIGLTLADLDPDWPRFLQFCNGAALLEHGLLGAGRRSRRYDDIVRDNVSLWDIECYRWLKEHYVAFLATLYPMTIGFVREGSRARCIAYMSEPTDVVALPIASSFAAFMGTLLEDVEAALRAWKPSPGQEEPEWLPPAWPDDVAHWCRRDPALKAMLQQGTLDDLFRADPWYSSCVDTALGKHASAHH